MTGIDASDINGKLGVDGKPSCEKHWHRVWLKSRNTYATYHDRSE